MRMTQPIRGMLAAIALSAAVVLSSAAPASAAITVTLSPTTGTQGTLVGVLASNCNQDATGDVEGTNVSFKLPKNNNNATGTFTVTDAMKPGTYTIAITCGSDTASAKFTVTSGTAPATGGGSTASDAASIALWSGAGIVAAAAAGMWLLKRRSGVTAA
ncbi:hypothetical protein SAMN05216298_3767 [Glycomyces sambucus]|uniref:LPXTG-motif cell wall anchor domain-containing protein n=1 Tax=Glycomyces sambucus TaxID=380244 RepID=A0A1G9JPR3_9ACTN|nr:hypothetical protein [Glycomyces sambucus]SDL39124.1 hypothetical protein SAMN05216298_3767 [Glycomyces sambucus]